MNLEEKMSLLHAIDLRLAFAEATGGKPVAEAGVARAQDGAGPDDVPALALAPPSAAQGGKARRRSRRSRS